MALEEKSTGGGAVFLSVRQGVLAETSSEPKEGFVSHSYPNKRTGETITKYFKYYNAVEGLVNSVVWYDTKDKYEVQYRGFKVNMDVDGQSVVLDLGFGSKPYDVFVRVAPNVDWSKPVKFSAWKGDDDKQAFVLWQDGSALKYAFTRENPNGCPEATFDEFSGWNFSAVNKFLYDNMVTEVIPKVDLAAAERKGSDIPF